MTKFKSIALLWVFLVVAAGMVFVFRFQEDESSADRSLSADETGAGDMHRQSANTSSSIKRLKKLSEKRKMMNMALNHVASKRQTDNKQYSLAELREITEETYFQMAPQVLENMFQQQAVDSSWTTLIQDDADKFFEKMFFEGTSLHSIECRQTLCKVAFDHDNAEKHETFVKGPVHYGPWIQKSGEAFGSSDQGADGTIHSYLYFTHEGDFDTFLKMRETMADIIVNDERSNS